MLLEEVTSTLYFPSSTTFVSSPGVGFGSGVGSGVGVGSGSGEGDTSLGIYIHKFAFVYQLPFGFPRTTGIQVPFVDAGTSNVNVHPPEAI